MDEIMKTLNTWKLDDKDVRDYLQMSGATVTAGNTIWFEMASNPTTGYDWIFDNEDCNSFITIEDSYQMDEEGFESGMMGVPGTTTVKLTGFLEGQCTWRAAYARDWEFTGFNDTNNMDMI